MDMEDVSFNIIANGVWGWEGLSGGDAIFIELARRLARKGIEVNVFTWEDGYEMCGKNNLTGVHYHLISARKYKRLSFGFLYFIRTLKGMLKIKTSIKQRDLLSNKRVIVYSASDFWPDSIVGYFFKCLRRDAKWIAGFYLFAPSPWQKDSPYKGAKRFTGLFYWLTQLPVYWLVKKYADTVFVTSEPDIKKFVTKKRPQDNILVIRGGVDIKPSQEYLKSQATVPFGKRRYDACFMGRFHYQKGVLELIDIWRFVCKAIPAARLAMIGNGSLEKKVRERIKRYKLDGNVELTGYLLGSARYDIFKQSKIVVHPATYDSGGMAACELMAWGLPGVGFDLESLKTYYPKGMLKATCFDLNDFARKVLMLLKDENLYHNLSKEAYAWAQEWDWDRTAQMASRHILN